MEISKLKHAQIKRTRFAMPVQMRNTNSRSVDVVSEDAGLSPVGSHDLPVERGGEVGHGTQASLVILCPFDILCTRYPQILASVKHLVTFFVVDEQFGAIR